MAYSELIKNFERVRGYMEEFYIYGFKTRDEYSKKSTRSYDNERRRIESYLSDYIKFKHLKNGKNIFISIDSRIIYRNPFYKALKAKSFTDNDITLHFILFDILYSQEVGLSLNDIMKKIDSEYLNNFSLYSFFDDSTIRKKLSEYIKIGLIEANKFGKHMLYNRKSDIDLSSWKDAISFFSEIGGCGVIGSFLCDKLNNNNDIFSFKHHYINIALNSEILYNIFLAISDKKEIIIKYKSRRSQKSVSFNVVPLKVLYSVQNGRQYLFAYNDNLNQIRSYRIDYIYYIKQVEIREDFLLLENKFKQIKEYLWGVSFSGKPVLEYVEFYIYIGDNEKYIYNRLIREKRCGIVEWIDENICRFSAYVYDTSEMIPWIRTFICRIIQLNFSNRTIENQLKQDICSMYELYDIGDDE